MMATAVTDQAISCMTVVHLVFRYDILMPVHIKIAVFLDVKQYCPVNMYQNFRAVGCLHLQTTFQATVTLRSPPLDIKADNLTSRLKNCITCLHYQPSLPS